MARTSGPQDTLESSSDLEGLSVPASLRLLSHHLRESSDMSRPSQTIVSLTRGICDDGIEEVAASPRIVRDVKRAKIQDSGCYAILRGSTPDAWGFI